jgi:hypothetical protein
MKKLSSRFFNFILLILFTTLVSLIKSENNQADEGTIVCGGFIEFDKNVPNEIKKQIDYSKIEVQSFTTDMIMKEHTTLAASGYYFVPVYENEPFILKISGPYGMNFEPEQYVFTLEDGKTIHDICKQDINFKFRGFVVEGQISTFGSNNGPEGINLVLYDEKNEKIQTTKTVENGLFRLKPINPGSYTIKPHDNTEMFDKNHKEFKFTVNLNGSNFFERALIVKGFKVTGNVLADNEPLQGAYIFIYTYNTTLVKDYNCENNKSLDKYKFNNISPFCVTKSNKEGIFTFNNIPYGEFIIRPLYENEYISYNLDPEHLSIEVKHKDYKLSSPFIANRFSVYGKVVNSKGNGVANVMIKIDGQVKGKSDDKGIYKLENLTTGNYDLEANADDMFFDPLTNIKITAHINKLPDLVVTDYKLCGVISIEAKESYSTNKRSIILKDASKTSQSEQRTITDQNGRYCFEVKPGFYHITPVLTQEEKESDLHLQPEYHEIEIVDRPRLDADFYQSKVSVSGKVKFLNETDIGIKVHLVSLKNEKVVN